MKPSDEFNIRNANITFQEVPDISKKIFLRVKSKCYRSKLFRCVLSQNNRLHWSKCKEVLGFHFNVFADGWKEGNMILASASSFSLRLDSR